MIRTTSNTQHQIHELCRSPQTFCHGFFYAALHPAARTNSQQSAAQRAGREVGVGGCVVGEEGALRCAEGDASRRRLVYLSKLVEVMLHIFYGGINGQASHKDLLCPRHQLAKRQQRRKRRRSAVMMMMIDT